MRDSQHVTGCGHLWAIGYDDMQRADQVRECVMLANVVQGGGER